MPRDNRREWDKVIFRNICYLCFCILTSILIYSCSSGYNNNINKQGVPIDSLNIGGPIFFNNIEAEDGTGIGPVISYHISSEGHDGIIIPARKNVFWAHGNKTGNYVYSIKYPRKVLERNYENFSKNARAGGVGSSANISAAISNVRYNSMEISWIDEGSFSEKDFKLKSNQKGIIVYATKKIEIPIEVGMNTQIFLNYALDLVKDGAVRQYTGDLKSVIIGNIAPMYIFGQAKQATFETSKVLYKKKEIFSGDVQDLFDKVTTVSSLLHWRIRYSNKTAWKVILERSVLAENFYLSIDISKQSDLKTLVTLSAYSIMDNTEGKASNLSQKYIDEFCTNLGT